MTTDTEYQFPNAGEIRAIRKRAWNNRARWWHPGLTTSTGWRIEARVFKGLPEIDEDDSTSEDIQKVMGELVRRLKALCKLLDIDLAAMEADSSSDEIFDDDIYWLIEELTDLSADSGVSADDIDSPLNSLYDWADQHRIQLGSR